MSSKEHEGSFRNLCLSSANAVNSAGLCDHDWNGKSDVPTPCDSHQGGSRQCHCATRECSFRVACTHSWVHFRLCASVNGEPWRQIEDGRHGHSFRAEVNRRHAAGCTCKVCSLRLPAIVISISKGILHNCVTVDKPIWCTVRILVIFLRVTSRIHSTLVSVCKPSFCLWRVLCRIPAPSLII